VADAPRDEPAAAATGYLGLTLSGAQLRLLEPDGVWVSHCEYPVVEAVDPGSPAARAGVQAGDTLVAFNSIDLRARAVSYPALLLPGTTLRLHLRRAGDVRVRAVVVAPRGDAPEDPRR
jgi:S1-C subfamily serine protease